MNTNSLKGNILQEKGNLWSFQHSQKQFVFVI